MCCRQSSAHHSLFIDQVTPKKYMHLRQADFQDILILSALKERDPISPLFKAAIEVFEPQFGDRLQVQTAEVKSRSDLIDSLNRHSPDDIQIRGRRTSDPPPWELRTLRSPPMRRLWRADQVRNAIWQSIPPSRRTSPIVFSSPLISSAYAGTGLGRRSSIKLKIFWNKLLGTATSANWNVTYRP